MATEHEDLDAGLMAAHGSGDWRVLSQLHETAANLLETPEEERFHLTHAWVFALVGGDDERIAGLETRLKSLGGL